MITLLLLLACGGSAPIKYDTVKVDHGDIVAKVTASGTVAAHVTVQVGSQVSGRLEEISVDFNSEVHKGQVIARIDPRLVQSEVEQARANVTAAKSRLQSAQARAADAKRKSDRAQGLADRKLVAQADADTAAADLAVAVADVAAAKGAVEQSQASLDQSLLHLDYTDIVSPIDGVVISRNVNVGQTVAASFQAPVLFTIAEDLMHMQVHASVSEADVGRLDDKTTATFTVDAWPENRFEGTIRQVRFAPLIQSNVVTYEVIVDVENPDLKLRPGMTANVTFEVARRDQALRVPNAALRFKPTDVADAPRAKAADGSRTVWVLADGTPKPLVVKTGLTDGAFTEVVAGPLVPDADVITDQSGGSSSSGGGQARSPFSPAGGRGH